MPGEMTTSMGTSADLGSQASASTQAPAQTSAPVSQESGIESDLASAFRQEMQSRFGSTREILDRNLPEGLLGEQNAQPQQAAPEQDANTQITELEPETEQENPESNQEQAAEREDGREEITAIHLEKFGRDYSLAEVEAAIEGFNYYHPKAMKFSEDLQRFQAEKQQFEQMKNSPDMQLVNMLKSDPGLKQRFLQVAREYNPQKMQSRQESQELTALKNEIAQLKGVVDQTQKAAADREAERKQAGWQQHVTNTTRAVDQAVTQRLETLKSDGVEIADSDLELISQNAVAQIKAGLMRYEPQAVTAYFNQMIDLIASKAVSARKQGVQNYRQQKQTLPPPPPSGGAAPVIQPNSPRNFQEMEGMLANRLEAVLNQM